MILLTGAAGYIGSHTWLALHAAGLEPFGLDSFANSSPAVLGRLAALGVDTSRFVEADVATRRRSTRSSPPSRSTPSSTSRR
jgi:UDP-glucose 4-epimerase